MKEKIRWTDGDDHGLTKRETFAAMALQGLLACPHQMCNDIENQTGLAVEYADKLIEELNKGCC